MRRIGWVAVTVLALGCAGRTPDAVDPGAAQPVIQATAPDRPLRAIFQWRILDGGARFSGEGAGRIEPPYRSRLDLFGPRGEGYLSAALVGAELRLPGPDEDVLPPPAMMWAVLGVVRPPEDAVLRRLRREDGATELHYTVEQSRLRYRVVDGRLRSAEWRGGGRRMVVELTGVMEGLPAAAAYRDWSRNTELHIELETVEEVEPYPSEIWTPDR